MAFCYVDMALYNKEVSKEMLKGERFSVTFGGNMERQSAGWVELLATPNQTLLFSIDL